MYSETFVAWAGMIKGVKGAHGTPHLSASCCHEFPRTFNKIRLDELKSRFTWTKKIAGDKFLG
jgi:hypothetical protein